MELFKLSKIFLRKSAAKEDDLKAKYPADKVDLFLSKDPTPNKKYTEWMLKQLSLGHPESEILYFTDYFHKHNSILSSKDLNSFSLQDLKDEFNQHKEEIKQKELKKDNRNRFKSALSEKIYESDKFIVYRMDNKAACEKHGLGTTWCITTSDPENEFYKAYYEYAAQNFKHYYIIDKEAKEQSILSKIAYTIGKDEKDIRNAQDDEITDEIVKDYIGDEFNNIYNSIINDYKNHTTTKEYDNINNLNNMSDDEILDLLQNDGKFYIIEELTKKQLSENIIRYILNNIKDERAKELILTTQKLPEDIIKSIVKSNNVDDIIKLIRTNKLSEDILKELITHRDYGIVNAVIKNHELPEYMVEYILENTHINTQIKAILYQKNIPKDIIEKFFEENKSYISKSDILKPYLSYDFNEMNANTLNYLLMYEDDRRIEQILNHKNEDLIEDPENHIQIPNHIINKLKRKRNRHIIKSLEDYIKMLDYFKSTK